MCVDSKLRYSERFECNIDLIDNTVFDVKIGRWGSDYGKIIKFWNAGGYMFNRILNLSLHKVKCDACVYNPRPDLFTWTDHINGDTSDNRASNLRHVNSHLNHLNRHNDDQNIEKQVVHLKNGKCYTIYRVRKCDACIKTFKNISRARIFAKMFNLAHFAGIYKLYVESPEKDTEEWREYWKKHLIAQNYDRKTHHDLILSGKLYIVGSSIFAKLTT